MLRGLLWSALGKTELRGREELAANFEYCRKHLDQAMQGTVGSDQDRLCAGLLS